MSSDLAKAEFLQRDLAMTGLSKLEKAFFEGSAEFPSMVAEAICMFHDKTMLVSETFYPDGTLKSRFVKPLVDTKQKTNILNWTSRILVVKDLALAERGLEAPSKVTEKHTHTTQILNIQLSPEQLNALPPGTKELLVEAGVTSLRDPVSA